MVSAGNLDKTVNMEHYEHFFNDVKYSTISLERDRKQIKELFDESIFDVDVTYMKNRLSEEYVIFSQATYENVKLIQCARKKTELDIFLRTNERTLTNYLKLLHNILEKISELKEYGLITCDTWSKIQELIYIGIYLKEDVKPAPYWFLPKKYDFMQELLGESQNKAEEFLKAKHKLSSLWTEKVYEAELVAALDYYMEKRRANFKLFDLTFHKCKKMLREQFVHEDLDFTPAEIECLNENLYCVKRNEYWLSRNYSRVRQFLGENYDSEHTDFASLRRKYELILRFYETFHAEDSNETLKQVLINDEQRRCLADKIEELKDLLEQINIDTLEQLCQGIQEPNIEEVNLAQVYDFYSKLFITVKHLEEDYTVFTSRMRNGERIAEFQMDDLRKNLYVLDRIAAKNAWFEGNKKKIQEVFQGAFLGIETDWDKLKEIGRAREVQQISSEENRSKKEEVGCVFDYYEEATEEGYRSYLREQGMEYQEYSSDEQMVYCIAYLLGGEQPIHEQLLQKRVASLLHVKRLTSKIKEQIQNVLRENENKLCCKEESFYCLQGDIDIKMRIPKCIDERRDISHISKEELKAGILTIIDRYQEIILDEISKKISSLLGNPRRSKKISERIEVCVMELKREEKIVRHSGGWRRIE